MFISQFYYFLAYYQNISLMNCKIWDRCDYFQLNFQFSSIFQTNPFFTLLQMFDFAKLFTSGCGSESTAAGVDRWSRSALIIETIFQNHSKSRSGKPYIIYLPIICNVFSHSLLNVITCFVLYPIWPANKRMIICTYQQEYKSMTKYCT